ncbi:MAG: hypothetical protein GXY43_04145 [Clostridiaceae bacterium]|nr:hypothetical protein [Clostridiaceae bacterium]
MIVDVKTGKDNIKKAVTLTNICSSEHYARDGEGDVRRLIENLSLEVFVGEGVGVSAQNPTEARLLMEIIANIRPYYSGRCVLAEMGMMQHKRRILPHVFFVDTAEMLYNNMSVLEFLVFATDRQNVDSVTRQKHFLKVLIDMDFETLAFSRISTLSDTEKILIEMIIAAESKSLLVIASVPDYLFSVKEIRALNVLFKIIKEHGSIIVGTSQASLIGICCEKVAFLIDGRIEFFGSVSDLCKSWDKVLYRISDTDPESTAKKLSEIYDEYTYRIDGSGILVYNYSEKPLSDAEFMRRMLENGIRPDYIKINKGRVGNSFEELRRMHGV